jgi:molybdopterin synthase sulfur carrier subunit
MAKTVRIPTPLRKLTNNEETVEVNAGTVGEAITELQSRYPGIKERLVDDQGEVRRFVNVYVNEEDIRFLKNQQTPLRDGDEISIIPAIAGG